MRKMKITTHDEIVAILATASYGSTLFGFYASKDDFKNEKYRTDNDCREDIWARILLDGKSIIVYDVEEDEEHLLDLKKLNKGLKKLAEKYPQDWADYRLENDDQTTMENLVQCAIFGDAIYG